MTEDQASIVAARAAAIEGERILIEGMFERIAAAPAPDEDEEYDEEPRFRVSRAERGVLRRNRDQAAPRLLAIAEGCGAQVERTRLYASTALGVIDRPRAFSCLLKLLGSEDGELLHSVLEELQHLAEATKGGGASEPLILDQSDANRLFDLLGHEDRLVADSAVDLLAELKPPETDERFLRLIAHPVVGWSIRWELTEERRPEVLDHAIGVLNARGEERLDGGSLLMLERFAQISPDPRLSERAWETLRALQQASSLAEQDRDQLEQIIGRLESYEAAATDRAAEFERASAVVERIVGAGLVDADEGRKAGASLRESCERIQTPDPTWGARAAFDAAGLLHHLVQDEDERTMSYDELIHEFAATSRGAFAPEAVYQPSDGREDDFPVQFVHRNRLYRFMTAHWNPHGYAELAAAANAALRDAGERGRFIPVQARTWSAATLFTDPERFTAIASEIGLPPKAIDEPDVVVVESLGDSSIERTRAALRKLLPDVDPDLTDEEFARAKDEESATALHEAAKEGRVDLIKALVAAGAELEAADASGWTALHRAAEAGDIAAIGALIDAGADIDAAEPDGWRPLHMAASDNKVEAIEALIRRGADLHARDLRGFTPLHSAANDHSKAAAALLLDRGIPVDVRTRKGLAREERLSSTGAPLTSLLAWAGWHIGGKVEAEQTPLHRAAYRASPDIVELLLDRGADVNAVDARLQTPLHLAIARGNSVVAEILRVRGADPDLRDDQGRTPAERTGDDELETKKTQRGLRRLVWLIRLILVVTFPVRMFARAARAVAGVFSRGEQIGESRRGSRQ
ncbi:ankyrin repeat domain-containing protein [Paludisphaera rhizosphaerae]|uniref:ankyrin repeat domain-containing protein n=1 Tax=Paludisphaera rhizosphaerae TaxID=2711216 RepID=UPI0013EAAD99|nr:ankyrin repeat domain-containing protein [Paludisphaera rhizosphaerae]